jgi:thymidine kinase
MPLIGHAALWHCVQNTRYAVAGILWAVKKVMVGFLGLIMGCMFSAKTSALISQIERQLVLQRRVVVVVPDLDTRCTDTLWTHSNGANTSMRIRKHNAGCLASFADTQDFVDADVIGVDEGQFFADLECVIAWVSACNKIVWVAGLNGSWCQNPMGQLLNLVPHADNVLFLRALCLECRDGTPASFTKRLSSDGQNNKTGSDIDIGAADKYVAVCRRHLHNK